MSGPPVSQILAELRACDVQFEVDGDRVHVNAPKEQISEQQLQVLRSQKPAIRSRLEQEARLFEMSFEEYGRTDLTVELVVPWMKKHLWLVPNATSIDQLVDRGVDRGCIWTAAELIDLYRIEQLQQNDRKAVALLKAHFNIKILSVEDWLEGPGDASR